MVIERSGQSDSIIKEEMTNKKTGEPASFVNFDENFNVRVKIDAGDVFMARFPNSIGTELRGDHLVVAVTNSNVDNPNVLIVPLTSLKEKHILRSHCMFLGEIKGITNGKQSVAMFNQMTTIDKRRLLRNDDINKFLSEYNDHPQDFDDGKRKIETRHYRLTLFQFRKLMFMFDSYIHRNSQIGRKHKLVDF